MSLSFARGFNQFNAALVLHLLDPPLERLQRIDEQGDVLLQVIKVLLVKVRVLKSFGKGNIQKLESIRRICNNIADLNCTT
jgi:hypothetical protein